MNFEAKIISKHNLDLSNIESLANDIATRLNRNVEFGEYSRSDDGHNFISIGIITKNEKGLVSTLYNLQKDTSTNYDYVLELGDEAKLIYKDIISFIPAWEQEFTQIQANYNEGSLTTDSYYAGIFDDLNNLGGDEVYFIKETNDVVNNIHKNHTWDNYTSSIQEKEEFFIVPISKI